MNTPATLTIKSETPPCERVNTTPVHVCLRADRSTTPTLVGNGYISPSTSTSFPTTGSGSRLCCTFFLGAFECCILSLSFSFFPPPLDGWDVNGELSPSSFSGDMMSFIFRPSASRNVNGSSLGAPPWNSDDFEEDDECFLEDDDDEAAGREWEKEWLPLLPPPPPPSRLRSLEECEEKGG